MTSPTTLPPPSPAVTFPAVFDGIGALVVSSALDPAALVAKIKAHSPGLSWIAPKLTGADTGGDAEVRHCLAVWKSLGLKVGGWIYCDGPPITDVRSVLPWLPLDFIVYDVEREYKSDETWEDPPGTVHHGQYEWAARLENAHRVLEPQLPAAVTSYGGYKTAIDFAAFARHGWPILAQVYDAFQPGDEISYYRTHGGPYPWIHKPVHRLTRSLTLAPGEAVYRPESIDG